MITEPTPPNKPHALNPAIALWFQFEYHWRGVSDAGRSLRQSPPPPLNLSAFQHFSVSAFPPSDSPKAGATPSHCVAMLTASTLQRFKNP
jgi:hypothetical protein